MPADPLDLFRRTPREAVPADARVLLSVGNCQAESVRAVMPEALTTVRTPPVHELTAAEATQLHAWLERADFVVLQPIRDDYRGLPVGTRQLLASTRAGTGVAVLPVIRFAGLYPRHLIIRPPSDTSLTPPLVAYHDAGVLMEAAGSALPALTARATAAIAAASTGELREREQRHGTVVVSDLFASPTFDSMRTINHPGNPVWAALGARTLEALGLAQGSTGLSPRDPGRPLLDSVHAPREQAVIDAFGLDAESTSDWTVDGCAVPSAEVRLAHLRWYAEHPDAVTAGLHRHATTLRELAAA
ncbi:WcbI family polysaccharide biosynthesis putative acetyltransferase [Herbiconiux sp. YIM B11900]|uniref:WcbI family polysaccharide biosynthesis putative acetyltransferase n=1 Tax=Herbiconiux sp. YIM B11900 TaxID=3404131 RepID=UPI003F836F4C